MKLLIINSDTDTNRGDRAILAGNIALLKKHFPDAKISALSSNVDRDKEWYGIDFVNAGPYSTSPLSHLKLMNEARKSDIVFWGGGELLKDYTNVSGLFYWFIKIATIRLVQPRIVGMFQGIGPTSKPISKRLIRSMIDMCEVFFVRDELSLERSRDWGAKTKMISSIDPAIYEMPLPSREQVFGKLEKDDIDEDFFKKTIGIGVRNWFHYKKSGLLPFWLKQKFSNQDPQANGEVAKYKDELTKICQKLTKQGYSIVFVPMHTKVSEGDISLAEEIASRLNEPAKTRVLKSDIYSHQDISFIMGLFRGFLGVRLHSTIISSSSYTPSVNLYYVDKGRLFFEQIGMQDLSVAIEEIQHNPILVQEKIDYMLNNSRTIESALKKSIQELRKKIDNDFSEFSKKN